MLLTDPLPKTDKNFVGKLVKRDVEKKGVHSLFHCKLTLASTDAVAHFIFLPLSDPFVSLRKKNPEKKKTQKK